MIKASQGIRAEGLVTACSGGVVIGVAQKLQHQHQPIPEYSIQTQDVAAELQRLQTAVAEVSQSFQAEIQQLQQHDDIRFILEAHRMMLHDPELIGASQQLIKNEHINVEWALKKSLLRLAESFDAIKDEYLRSRKADVEHVGQRLLACLTGTEQSLHNAQQIMIAADFSPANIVAMWRNGVAGFVSVQGGADSHAMIVARGIGLPGLAGVQHLFDVVEDGDALIVDAEQGKWILHPNPEEYAFYQRVQQSLSDIQHDLKAYVEQPSQSQDGYVMPLMANLEFTEETAAVHRFGVDGIGLFRTEFLFMQTHTLPNEQLQYEHYQHVVVAMAGKPTTFRLLDIGHDKITKTSTLNALYTGENPALGLCGVRLLLSQMDILETQLRALIKTARAGPISILVPMVTSAQEMLAVRQLLDALKISLQVDIHIPLGCMIEVPAAALIADDLAKVSDFFSIGSNDLMQYSLAVDRADEHVSHLYDASHPAIAMLINLAVAAAHRHDIPISVCGELAANPDWTQTFLDMGITSLSMSSRSVLSIRQHLHQLKRNVS